MWDLGVGRQYSKGNYYGYGKGERGGKGDDPVIHVRILKVVLHSHIQLPFKLINY
jgi:hypothetical protein